MLLPVEDPDSTHIMIATRTDVAPYKGYLIRMFMEHVSTCKFWGLAWLFLGVANTDSLHYDEEFSKYLRDHSDNFRKNEKQIGLNCKESTKLIEDERLDLMKNSPNISMDVP